MPQPFVVARLEESEPLLSAHPDPSIRRQLLDDCEQVGLAEAQQVTWDRLAKALKASRLAYDMEAVYRIFVACETPTPTVRAFCDMYCSRLTELRRSIRVKQTEISRLEELISQSLNNVRKVEAEERSGIAGASEEESTLIVQVVSITNLPNNIGAPAITFRLHLECGELASETSPLPLESTDLFWNSMFSFEKVPKDATLRLTLLKSDEISQAEEELCDCSIMLDELADQRRHSIIREMWGILKCEIHLNCQWLYSRVALYRSFNREFSAKREVALKELENAKLEESQLVSPFGLMRGRSGFGGVIAGIRDGPQVLSASIDRVIDNMKLTNSHRALQVGSIIMLALSACCSYARAAYFDLCISCIALWNSMDCYKRWTEGALIKLLVACLISLVLDVMWIKACFSKSGENGLAKVEIGLRTATKLSSLLNFAWKVRDFFDHLSQDSFYDHIMEMCL